MAVLEPQQRDAIFARYGGFIQSYFTDLPLETRGLGEGDPEAAGDQEFYDYLRLSTLLAQGAQLCRLLERVILAPASAQVPIREFSRGRVRGRIDVRAQARRVGQVTTVPAFPVRRVGQELAVDENLLAASCADGVLQELQDVLTRIQLPASSERLAVAEIAHLLDIYLREPALDAAVNAGFPGVRTLEFVELADRVGERWQTRRISNVAYAELLFWARDFRRTVVGGTEGVPGFVYSDEFDDRLFELFVLGVIRDALNNLGFSELVVRPIHAAGEAAIVDAKHNDSGLQLAIHFQRAAGVLWTSTAQRAWPTIRGVPDIVLRPESAIHPLILVDAKNRRRTAGDAARASEETYKLLGYFENFGNRLVVNDRGPVGGLVFQSVNGSARLDTHESENKAGAVVIDAWDPCDDALTQADGVADGFLRDLFAFGGLVGGRRPDGRDVSAELAAVYADAPNEAVGDPGDDDTADIVGQIARVHEFAQRRYWEERGPAVLRAEQDLETHMLGTTAWSALTEEERRFAATAEIFWRDHGLAVGMDFGPLIIELAKACESCVDRLLFSLFKEWAAGNGRATSKLDTLGDMRAELQRASEVHGGVKHGPSHRAPDEYLAARGIQVYAYGTLLDQLTRLNGPRRAAAHPHTVAGAHARAFRDFVLGVGEEPSFLAQMINSLG